MLVDKSGPVTLVDSKLQEINKPGSSNVVDRRGSVPHYHLENVPHAEFCSKPAHLYYPEQQGWNTSNLYDRIIYYYLNHGIGMEALISSRDSLSALNNTLRIITAEWLNVCHITECEVAKLGGQHEAGNYPQLGDMEDELKRLHTWRRRAKRYAEIVGQVIEDCKWRGPLDWCRHDDGEEIAVMRANDFEAIWARFSTLREVIKDQLTIVLNEILIENSKLARKADHEILRLSIAAFIFLPLSWLAALLSINETLGVTSKFWWIYVVVAIPLTLAVVMLGLGFQKGGFRDLLCAWRESRTPPETSMAEAQKYGYALEGLY